MKITTIKIKPILIALILLLTIKTNKAQVDIFWGKDNPLEKGGTPELLVKRGNTVLGSNTVGRKKK